MAKGQAATRKKPAKPEVSNKPLAVRVVAQVAPTPRKKSAKPEVSNKPLAVRVVTLQVPPTAPTPKSPPGKPGVPPITGRAVLSPAWKPGVLIEAFGDAELTQLLGRARTGKGGCFEIRPSSAAGAVWFRWSQGKQHGRSPKLQPLSPAAPVRLHVYGAWEGPARGSSRFNAEVRSTSGRAAVGMPVALLEVTLQRCQLLGEAVSGTDGSAQIAYDASMLFTPKPDLRLLVFDARGTPLLEQASASAVLPGTAAQTRTAFSSVGQAFSREGLIDGTDACSGSQDLDYMAARTGLPARRLASYGASAALAPTFKVPPEALFAMLESGATDLHAALQQGVEQDLVSPALLAQAGQLVPMMKAAVAKQAAQADLGAGSLDAFLATQVKNAGTREKLAGLILDVRSRSALRAAVDKQKLASPAVRFLIDLQSITGVDAGVASVLARRKKAPESGDELALLGTSDWKDILGKAQKSQGSKKKADPATLTAQARLLKQRAQMLFPDKVFNAQLERYAKQTWSRNIRSYFKKHPDRSFSSPLPVIVGDNNGGKQGIADAAGVAALAAYKRVLALTQDHMVVGALLEAGLTSARRIAGVGVQELSGQFADTYDGDTAALEQLHGRAIQKTAALNYAGTFLPMGGHASLCDCADCKSIFGPAAYLFELLSLFRRYTDSSGHSLLTHLDDQRPDITRTALSCPNTTVEVPQIDLVNEILEDKILDLDGGGSVVHGLGPGVCLPPERRTQGTSEERRAIPQNQPSDGLLGLLSTPSLPWTLPYDYHRDRARSARERLVSRPEQVALEVWRAAVITGSASAGDAITALAGSTVDFGAAEADLVTTSISTLSGLTAVWGANVHADLAASGTTVAVRLEDLAAVAATDLETLEDVLDTAFVGAAPSGLAIVPSDFCRTGDPPELSGRRNHFIGVLDRFHRFERLRRALGWEVQDLDEALAWLGGTLDAAALEHARLLRFFERRLGVAPAQLMTLFRDPEDATPPTLRPRSVVSPFAAQFGAGTSTFDVPVTTLEQPRRVQSTRSQIAKAAGEPPATVDLAFGAGLVDGLAGVADVLAAADPQAAYRKAVSATYRLSRWAQSLGLDAAGLLDLVAIGGLDLLRTGTAAGDRLRAALALVDLGDRQSGWPVSASGLRYLIGDDPASRRRHALSASAVGAALMELRQNLVKTKASIKPLPHDPRAALEAQIARLLAAALPKGSPATSVDAEAADLTRALEWSDFFPGPARDANATLGHTVKEWPGLTIPPAISASDRSALDAALDGVSSALSSDHASRLRSALADRLAGTTSAGDALPAGVDEALLSRAMDAMDELLQDRLAARAATVLAVGETCYGRVLARQTLADWSSARLGASAATAQTVLDQLSDPARSARSIAGAFIDDAGAPSTQLSSSAVRARYLASPSGKLLLERDESALVFDWSKHPPVAGLEGRAFSAELEVTVPASSFATPLVVETDGAVEVDAGGTAVIRETAPEHGEVRQHEAHVHTSASSVRLRIRYTAPAAGARALRVYTRDPDGVLEELPWAVLTEAVERVQRAALALSGATLPASTWSALAPATGRARSVDLDSLSRGAPFADWQAFFSLGSLVKRIRTPQAAAELVAFLAGAAVARDDLLGVLNLEDDELDGALELLHVSSAASVALPAASISFRELHAVLALLDRARSLHLPAGALAQWNEATPAESYEWALAALRVGLDESEWLQVLAEVYNPVRARLRDAQLDYLVGRHMGGTTTGVDLPTREDASDYLLTDVQMSPCMTTSRIQFAFAAVQRYVQTAQAGRAPWLAAGQESDFAHEWVSLRQYRLHEAEMRVLVHAENWIDPAVRPTKTPAFEQLEETMHSGPLSLELAEGAMKQYAAALTEVAHLEPVAIVTQEKDETDRPLAFRDPELQGTHVFARTRAQPRHLYYRRRLPLPDGRWTPWESIDAELEGTHYLAVVAFGRVRLLCADFSVARQPRSKQCQDDGSSSATDQSQAAAGQSALSDYEVTLSWIDREHGRWSRVHRSGRFPFSIALSDPPSRAQVFQNAFPSEQFPDVDAHYDVDNVEIDLQFADSSGDGLKGGRNPEELRVRLQDDSGATPYDDSISGPIAPGGRGTATWSDIPAGTSLEGLTKIRLDWNVKDDHCKVTAVDVVFKHGSLPIWPSPVSSGRMHSSGDSRIFSVGEGLPFQQGYTGDPGTLGRHDWEWFEAQLSPLQLHKIRPAQEDFEIQYELVPQSIDLSHALAIQADVRDDSFDVCIYSVPHSEMGKLRGHFKLVGDKASIPEVAQNWGTDWVTGTEFCYTVSTDSAGAASLKIYPDDTIQQTYRGQTGNTFLVFGSAASVPPPMGQHEGTAAAGQSLTGTGRVKDSGSSGGWGWLSQWLFESWEYPVFCDGHEVATAPVRYDLTVQRTGKLSSQASPKILDEEHSDGRPARTLFLERTERLAPPAAPSTAGGGAWIPLEGWIPLSPTVKQALAQMGASGGASATLPAAGGSSTDLSITVEQANADIQLGSGLRDLPAGARGAIQDQIGNAVHDLFDHVWRFSTFWHPQAVGFRRLLESRGLPRLVRFDNQILGAGTDLGGLRDNVQYFDEYRPTRFVDGTSSPDHFGWPWDAVDFTPAGPFAEYNWELFFDALLFIAQRFDEEGRYDDADEIFALLVDRTQVARPGAWETGDLYQTAPLRAGVQLENDPSLWIDTDTDRLREEIVAQITRIRENPYEPHIIARGWPAVYARALRIKYAEHLIHAGEADFRRAYAADNRSYLESASLRFDLAARVLGPAVDTLPAAQDHEVACYEALTHGSADDPPDGIEALEPYIPDGIFTDGAVDHDLAGGARSHFCVPRNPKLNELRALVADRLLKLRSCEDIDGVRRALSLYGRRIDPGLLVRATAEGLDLDVLLGRVSGARPSMYFQALWQRALSACERARALEDAWLGAQERADSEALAQLRNEQEIRSLEGQKEVASQQLEDARLLKESLQRTIENAKIRHDFYSSRKPLNAQETAEGKSMEKAGKVDEQAANDSHAASDWAWVPTADIYVDAGVQNSPPFGYVRGGASVHYQLGGQTGVQVYRANAEGHRNQATQTRNQAGIMGRAGQFARRSDDWKLQASLAEKDIQKGERDLAGAGIRIQIAQLQLDLHGQRVDDAKAVRTFLRDKFTSKELHAWHAGRLKSLRYEQHQLAYDLVSQARQALLREHGLDDQGYVADPWDVSRSGIGSAAALLHELEKQQLLYMESWRREQEKVKVFSLVERDPLAFLELIQTGKALFSITEADYDEDGAGDWFRRLRQVTIDIPAVRGPYTNVNARLTQLKGEVRVAPYRAPAGGAPSPDHYYRNGPDDPAFRDDLASGDFIVTNTAMNDDGSLFRRQDHENPPPFAMNGAVSTFRIELPLDQNHFDRQTITDVIVRAAITSRPGGEAAAQLSTEARRLQLSQHHRPVMFALHSAFSNEWLRFTDALAQGSGELSLTITRSHIPLWLRPVVNIVESQLFLAIPDDFPDVTPAAGTLEVPPGLGRPDAPSGDPRLPPPIHRLKLTGVEPVTLDTRWSLGFTAPAGHRIRRGWLVCWVAGTGNP